MNRILVFLLQTTIIMTSLSCSTPGEGKYKGKLFYSSATNHLYELDLSTSKEKIIHQEKYNTDFISHVASMPNHQLILSVEPMLESPRLELLDLTNDEVRTLRDGMSPTYIAEHNAVFFYVQEKPYGIKGDMYLYVEDLDMIDKSRLICALPKPDSLSFVLFDRPVVQISPDKIVFQGLGSSMIEYDYVNRKTSDVGLKNLWPLAWREKTKELICCSPRAGHFFLIDWSSKKVRPIDLGEDSMGWTYIKEYDILLFSKERLETGYIYYYDFENSKVEKLKSHSIVRNNAAYFQADSVRSN